MNGKFRVWDKRKKEWAAGAFYISENGQLWEFKTPNSDAPYLVTTSHKRYTVQFFTGLQDKSTKDIYVGDIVFDEFLNCSSIIEGLFDSIVISWYRDIDKLNFPMGTITVVGNLYENPELLK